MICSIDEYMGVFLILLGFEIFLILNLVYLVGFCWLFFYLNWRFLVIIYELGFVLVCEYVVIGMGLCFVLLIYGE